MYNLFNSQKQFYYSGATKSYEFRMNMLTKLKEMIKKNEEEIIKAVYKDLHKSEEDVFSTEIGFLYEEINSIKKNLKSYMKPKRMKTILPLIGSKSYIYPEPYGVTFIIAPWNYPFQLAIAPLIGAIAGGNTAILKPSELTPNVSALIKRMVEETFSSDYIAVIEGGVETTTNLLELPFDKIFFTGSVPVGKIIMKAASKHLTPVTLELGGKSPTIVTEDANLELAAKRIVWGKFLNAGQTCVAPDYLLVHEKVKDKLISLLKKTIIEFYGENPIENKDYTHIVNRRNFHRVCSYLSSGEIVYGGKYDENRNVIEPTLLHDVKWDSPIMQDEIFGPLLPILTFKSIDEVIHAIRQYDKPLALYLFTNDKEFEKRILQDISFGGGCINDTIMHLVNPELPFGGVGASGLGSYHGKYSFQAFTHEKSIVKQTNGFDLPARYPTFKYRDKLMKMLFK